jgi:hypothetical protein
VLLTTVARLLTITRLLAVPGMLVFTICRLLGIPVLRLLLVGFLVSLVLLCGRVRRVATVGIVALLILALGWRVVAMLRLLLLVGVVGWGLVCALFESHCCSKYTMRQSSKHVLTCPWGGYGLCAPPY